MGCKFSMKGAAKMNRIKNLPQKTLDTMVSIQKYYALKLIENFHEGIRQNSLGLKKLEDGTVKRKVREGYPYPEAPLYGAGDEKRDRSFMAMLRIDMLSKGYKVYPSRKKHWKSKLSLYGLFILHEYGGWIRKRNAPKEGMTMGDLIRIPARQPLTKAFKKMMKDRSKKDPSRKVKNAILRNINNAEDIQFAKEVHRWNEQLRKYEVKD